MATVKGGTSGGGCVKYITKEEKTKEKLIEGINCNPKTAIEEMKFTKEEFNKTKGTEYYHYIQSFKPGETTPEQAHEIGKAFAQRLAGDGYQAVLATHTDRDHIHNHVVLNSVSFETGRKFQFTPNDMKQLKEYSNTLCLERGLSTIDFSKKAEKNITTGEYRLQQKGQDTWKQDLREAIDFAKSKVNSVDEMQKFLKTEFNIEMKIQNKNLKFKHPDKEEFCKGGRLGANYEKEVLTNEFDNKKNRTNEERGIGEQKPRATEEPRIANVGGNEKQHIGNREINGIATSGTSNLDRQLLNYKIDSGTGQERIVENNREGNRGVDNIDRKQQGFERTGTPSESEEHARNNSDSKPNKQQTHSRTEQPNIESQPINIKHGEDHPRNEEQHDLDEEEYLKNRRNYNRSDSVGGSNINSNNIIHDNSTEGTANQRLSNGNNGLKERTDQAHQEKIKSLEEGLDKIAREKIQGKEIGKKVEFYSEREKQTVYVEEQIENGKIEVRASKNKNPFELTNIGLKEYQNYKSVNEASILFMIDRGYKAVSREKTMLYDNGEKTKTIKKYDEQENKGIKEELQKIKAKEEMEKPKLERKQEIDRDRGRSR